MRHLVTVVVLACGLTAPASQHPLVDLVGKAFEGRVTHVSDGDTLDVIPAGERRAIRIRVFGIDTPERGEPYSTQARNRTRTLAFEKHVGLTGMSVDHYGRLVAIVKIGATDLGLDLLSQGLACHHERYSDDKAQADAEGQARSAGTGFWAVGASKPRCAIASAEVSVTAKNAAFIGNVRSRVFHTPSCRNAGCKNCVRKFASADEAVAAGFRPAGDCLR